MALVKVRVDMDQNFVWWIPGEDGSLLWNTDTAPKTLEVDEVWLEELNDVSKRHREMQRVLENMYRKQEGLAPFKDDTNVA